ncbi:hypothetical protein Hanom_Chr15g01353641 [Helianthus anomalus]
MPPSALRGDGRIILNQLKKHYYSFFREKKTKTMKHAKACAENQHVFIPFAFDTFGSLAPEAINFLTRVQRVIHSNCSTPRGQGFVFGRLGFAIQKGLAAQLVARLPSVLM